MKEITLTKGYQARVPDEVYNFVNQWNWYYLHGYAVRVSPRDADGKQHKIYMHNVIFPPPPGLVVHHIDDNGLNNLFPNLRHVTPAVNNRFRGPHANSTSIYKGVHRDGDKWRADIKVDGVSYNLGTYVIEEDAARAYDAAAFAAWGNECYLNFPEEYGDGV